ncbi:MAG: hypothetical protein JRM86_03010 [Nitrososphaerota archaeon]|nr:hypothetical protein [Nitrososphaerota archaeon]MDG7022813.1 hypothetical protein [Nitrososphaerota archaeon]
MARVNRRLMGGPATYFVAILPSFLAPRGSAVAVGICVATLAYYVVVGSGSRGLRVRQRPER